MCIYYRVDTYAVQRTQLAKAKIKEKKEPTAEDVAFWFPEKIKKRDAQS